MFQHRRNSQKPSDELVKTFKDSFPQLHPGRTVTTASAEPGTTLAGALDSVNSGIIHQSQDIKDTDHTPRGSNEQWNFSGSGLTPSMMDPNSHAFQMFANHGYMPTPGGNSMGYPHPAGDLHTPNFQIGLGTPLSLPTSEGALHAGHQAAAFQHGFNAHLPHHVSQQPFQSLNPYHMHQQPSFPPNQFTHQTPFEHLDHTIDDSPVDDIGMDLSLHHHQHQQSPQMLFHSQAIQNTMQPPPIHPTGEKFRYHVTLNAPTAMIKNADDIPITYLNKGQAYTVNVHDTANKQSPMPLRYRTFVRVSFEDEQQRQKPAACWQLWKEGRGTNEAHQRGGRLQAVEYAENGHMGGVEDPNKPRIEIESESFDGFSVIWSPAATGPSECPIPVRFNFLSTDFSHSKGVKGIPVRLCTKTEAIGEVSPSVQPSGAEVCYCKVKLFRDHGAERKLSNDVAHVKKTIEKLSQQIQQIESGMRDMGKRKRSGSIAKATGLDNRPGKAPKHRRTWSISSVTSTGGRGGAEEDLHMKMMTLQDMFTSTRPASVLYLRGADEDDPDLYPVKLSGEPQALQRTESMESAGWDRQSSQTGPPSSLVSPTPSSNSLSGSRRQSGGQQSTLQQPTPVPGASRVNSSEWQHQPQMATIGLQTLPTTNPQHLASPPDSKQPIKVQTRSQTDGTSSGWIEALDVDQSYQAPPERAIKPVACFYIQPRVAGRMSNDNFHRAIYIYQRSLKEFVNKVAMKSNIEPTEVLRTVRISRDGLHILFDDDCIQELPEGQEMTAEFSEMHPETPSRPHREWDAGSTDIQADSDLTTIQNVSSTGYELRLLF